MDKRILILVGIALLFIGLIVVTLLVRGGETLAPPIETGTDFPSIPPGTSSSTHPRPPSGEGLRIPVRDGTVDVRDFRNDPQTVKTEGPSYRMYSFVEHPNYQIVYSEYEKEFLIALLALPLHTARMEAEATFLDTLQITKDEACKLKVSLGTIDAVDQQYAGRELGLSFCPGAVILSN